MAEIISKFVSGEGKSYILSAFEKLSQVDFGLTKDNVEFLIKWIAEYQGGQINNWLKDLVTSTGDLYNQKLSAAATDLAIKYIEQVGSAQKASAQLDKIKTAMKVMSSGIIAPLIIYGNNGEFRVNEDGIKNLISLANAFLGNSVNEGSVQIIKEAINIIVSGLNTISNEMEKEGAKIFLSLFGLVKDESNIVGGGEIGGESRGTGGIAGGGPDVIIPTAPIETPAGTPTPSPTPTPSIQKPDAGQQPSKEQSLKELAGGVSIAVKSGKIGALREELDVLPELVVKERDVGVAKEAVVEIMKLVGGELKSLGADEIKSVTDVIMRGVNEVGKKINAQGITKVKKVEELEELKFEVAGFIGKVYEALAVGLKGVDDGAVERVEVKAEDLISASKGIMKVFEAVKTDIKEIGKVEQLLGAGAGIKVSGKGKEQVIVLSKEVLDRAASEGKIKRVVIVGDEGMILLPISRLTADRVEIEIKWREISGAISSGLDIGIKGIEKGKERIVIVLKLRKEVTDESSISVYREENGQKKVVSGKYVKVINGVWVERKDLSTYYVGKHSKVYRDVDEGAWYYRSVMKVSASGVIEGYPDGSFRPNKAVSRAEFAKMLVEGLGLDTEGQEVEVFDDVREGDWYYKYVATLYNMGIVKGRSEGKFVPNGAITREEMAKMISLALKAEGKVAEASKANRYEDGEEISEWAREHVNVVTDNGIMEGRGGNKFVPKATATRAEVAAVIERIMLK